MLCGEDLFRIQEFSKSMFCKFVKISPNLSRFCYTNNCCFSGVPRVLLGARDEAGAGGQRPRPSPHEAGRPATGRASLILETSVSFHDLFYAILRQAA